MIKTKERRTTAWKRLWIKPDKKKIKLKPKRGEQKSGQKGQQKHHCIACRKVLENDKSLKEIEKNKNCTV